MLILKINIHVTHYKLEILALQYEAITVKPTALLFSYTLFYVTTSSEGRKANHDYSSRYSDFFFFFQSK